MVRQRRAGYTRHHYIGQQNTNRGIAIEDAQSLLSRRGADAHHSVVFEGLHHRPTNVRVIVYHEHDGMNWHVTPHESIEPQTDASPKSIRAASVPKYARPPSYRLRRSGAFLCGVNLKRHRAL
jgi:hypothetical protein